MVTYAVAVRSHGATRQAYNRLGGWSNLIILRDAAIAQWAVTEKIYRMYWDRLSIRRRLTPGDMWTNVSDCMRIVSDLVMNGVTARYRR